MKKLIAFIACIAFLPLPALAQNGMLDVYFAVRFLQLRDDIRDDDKTRSTDFMLDKLYSNKSLSEENYAAWKNGYNFLSALDHNLRLTLGRRARLPTANPASLNIIARRMGLSSSAEMLEQLTLHRLNIRNSFAAILKV